MHRLQSHRCVCKLAAEVPCHQRVSFLGAGCDIKSVCDVIGHDRGECPHTVTHELFSSLQRLMEEYKQEGEDVEIKIIGKSYCHIFEMVSGKLALVCTTPSNSTFMWDSYPDLRCLVAFSSDQQLIKKCDMPKLTRVYALGRIYTSLDWIKNAANGNGRRELIISHFRPDRDAQLGNDEWHTIQVDVFEGTKRQLRMVKAACRSLKILNFVVPKHEHEILNSVPPNVSIFHYVTTDVHDERIKNHKPASVKRLSKSDEELEAFSSETLKTSVPGLSIASNQWVHSGDEFVASAGLHTFDSNFDVNDLEVLMSSKLEQNTRELIIAILRTQRVAGVKLPACMTIAFDVKQDGSVNRRGHFGIQGAGVCASLAHLFRLSLITCDR